MTSNYNKIIEVGNDLFLQTINDSVIPGIKTNAASININTISSVGDITLKGTVNIIDDGADTAALNINGVPFYEGDVVSRTINTLGTHTLLYEDVSIIIDRPDSSGVLIILLPEISTLPGSKSYNIQFKGDIRDQYDRGVFITAAIKTGDVTKGDYYDGEGELVSGEWVNNFEVINKHGSIRIQSETGNHTGGTTNGWVYGSSHFESGNHIKKPVRVATVSNITLSTVLISGQVLDGITLAENDTVLVKDQSTASENGVYLVGALGGAPSRDNHWKEDHYAADWEVHVREGTVHSSNKFQVTNPVATSKIGTDNLAFSELSVSVSGADTQIQFNNSGAFGASADLTWDGTQLTTTGDFSYGGFKLPDANHLIDTLSTGLFKGGEMSAGAGATFDITAGNGLIVDSHTDPDNPTETDVVWGAINGTTITNLGNLFTHVYITTAGTVLQSIVEPTATLRRDDIYLGKVFHRDGINTSTANNQPDVGIDIGGQLHDFMRGLGPVILSGNRITANGSNLSIDKSAGDFSQPGVGFTTLRESPNIITIPLDTIVDSVRSTQLLAGTTTFTTLDVGNYDLAGTVTAIPGSSNRSTNMRVYLFNSGFVSVQYGQEYYGSLALAESAISTETFVTENNAVVNGILIAIVSVRKGATDLSLSSDAAIFNASKFGEVSVGAAGAQTTDLQAAYNNSVTPEITVDTTRGAFTVIDNASPIAANLFEVQTNAPANVFEVDINGVGITGSLEMVSKGAVTQITSDSTSVALNNPCGKITTVSLTLTTGTSTAFSITNSYVSASSVILANVVNYGGAGAISVSVDNIAGGFGSFDLILTNCSGTTLNALAVIGFMVV